MAKKPLTYADSGVDIDAGDRVVGLIESHMKSTYGPRVFGRHGGFAGQFRLDYNEKLFKKNYRDPVLVSCADGVGSKVKLATTLGIYDTMGIDCVAMNVNDMIVQGAEPLFFLDYLGIHKVVPELCEQIVKGVADGCRQSGAALLGGETAELPDIYAKGEFDLAGFAVGVAELKRMTDPTRTEAGDVILGLASSGVHSNGFSLVRRILSECKLDLEKVYPEVGSDKPLGQVLLTPTRIYVKAILEVLHNYQVKKPVSGMAHITGGGLPGNLPRALTEDVDARINKDAWEIPALFRFLQEQGDVDEAEMYRVFNMGIGYTLIVRPHFADAITRTLEKQGETVYRLGEIVKGTGETHLV